LADVSEVAVEAAARAIESTKEDELNEITLSNGIKLSSKPIPPLLLTRAGAEVPRPQVPTAYLEDKGREEPNPDDPDYIQALQKYQMDLGEAATNVSLVVGTKIEHVPEELSHPDDEDWVQDLEAAGLQLKIDTEPARKLAWLRYYALSTVRDYNKTLNFIGRRAGLKEEDVAKAAESFPSGEGRGTDPDLPVEEGRLDGDSVSPNGSGGRPADRGAGDS